MALKLGSLYVSLSANTDSFMKSMADAAKAAERFAKQVKQVSSDVAQVGGVFAALGGAAVKLAATVDGPTRQAVQRMENSAKLLAVQVADTLLPAVRELTSMFQSAARAVAGLDPETKKQIASFAVMAVQVAAAAKVLSVLASASGSVFAVLRGATALLSSGFGAALLVAVGLVVLLHRAWRKNWAGIQETTKEVLEWFRDAFSRLGGFVSGVWKHLVAGAATFAESMLKAVDVLQDVTGKKLVDTGGLRDGLKGLWKDLANGDFVANAFEFGKTVGGEIVDGIKDEWAAIQKELGFGGGGGTPIGLGRGAPSGPVRSGALADPRTVQTRPFLDSAMASGLAEHTAQMEAAWAEQEAAAQVAAGALSNVSSDLKRSREQAKAALGIFVSGLGALGSTINSVVQGMQSGGVWGAIIAAVMEVFKRMQSFQSLLAIFEQGLVRLGEFLEPLLSGIFGIVETLTVVGTEMLAPIFKGLKPLFDGITKFAQGLVPILSAVGGIFEAVGPIIDFIGRVVGGILEALKPVLDLIGGVLKVVATVLLGIIIAANELAAFFGDEKAKAEAKRLKGVVDKMWDPRANELAMAESAAAKAAWKNAGAQEAAAHSAQKLAESLTNVPAGYRLAGARYGADMGITSPLAVAAATGGASSGAGGVTFNGDVTFETDASTIEDLGQDARREAARERGQQRGTPAASRRWD